LDNVCLLASNESTDDHAGGGDDDVEDHGFPSGDGNDQTFNDGSEHETTSNAEEHGGNTLTGEEPVSENGGSDGENTADDKSDGGV